MKKLTAYIFVVVMAFGCTDHFDSLNTNPVGIAELEPGIQLTKIQADLSGQREEVWRYDLGICSPLVQHLGGSWWTQHGGQYNVVEKSHWYTLWENTYPRDLKNIQDLIDRTVDVPEYKNMHAVARIMKVYIYARITDLYGDIPYKEAIKGFTEGKLLPKYDEQKDIYADFFVELEEATAALGADNGIISGDLFYDGNIEQWKRFGNSLRLRLGFRLTKVDLAEAQKQVEAAISGGVMTSNEDAAVVYHQNIEFVNGDDTENRGNGRSQVFNATPNSEGFRLTNTLVDYMTATNDPRLTIYGGTYLGDGTDITPHLQVGLSYGGMWWNEWSDHGPLFDENNDPVNDANGDQLYVSHTYRQMQPSKYVSALNAPFFHITYAEVELLLAEAAARNWGGVADPEAHFMGALEASCGLSSLYPNAPEISTVDLNALKDSFSPFPADFEGRMEVIHEQMWVNFFLNGAEAYSNYRRTGYPELVPFTSLEWYVSGTGGVMPRRFFYPESEAISNGNNLNEAVSRLGGSDDFLQRVWWDK